MRLIKLQLKLAANNKRSLIVVAEGPDAAGKGGAVKRLVEKLDPRTVRVYSTIKPTDEEIPAPLSVALLEQAAAAWADRDFRPFLVRAGPGRAGRRVSRPNSNGAARSGSSTSLNGCCSMMAH